MSPNTISRSRRGRRPKDAAGLLKLMSDLISLREKVAQAELQRRYLRPGALMAESPEGTDERKAKPKQKSAE